MLSPLSPLSPEPPGAPVSQALQPTSLRSPPDSEAYYGETDSDVDGPATQEKPRRTRRRGPARPSLPGAPPDEVYLSDSPAEPAPVKTGSPSQGDSRVSSPSWEEGAALQPPPAEALLLPHCPLRPGPHLIPMVGPVPHPVAEDLTTTYTQKAKQASECLNPFVFHQDLSPKSVPSYPHILPTSCSLENSVWDRLRRVMEERRIILFMVPSYLCYKITIIL